MIVMVRFGFGARNGSPYTIHPSTTHHVTHSASASAWSSTSTCAGSASGRVRACTYINSVLRLRWDGVDPRRVSCMHTHADTHSNPPTHRQRRPHPRAQPRARQRVVLYPGAQPLLPPNARGVPRPLPPRYVRRAAFCLVSLYVCPLCVYVCGDCVMSIKCMYIYQPRNNTAHYTKTNETPTQAATPPSSTAATLPRTRCLRRWWRARRMTRRSLSRWVWVDVTMYVQIDTHGIQFKSTKT